MYTDEELIEFYKSHSIRATAKQFGISRNLCTKILTEYNIPIHTKNDSLSFSCKGRTAWNKNVTNTVKYKYYTDGIKNIRIPDTQSPPNGFYAGRVVKWSDDAKKQKAVSTKATKLARYNNENYNNIEKAKATKIERFGDAYYNNKDKTAETCIKKYGVDNVFKSDVVKEKIAQTNLERYGYEYSFQNKNILNHAIENSTSADAQEKRMQTCLDKYGVPYAGCIFGTPNNTDSKANLNFKSLLEDAGFIITDKNREFTIKAFRYDFKIEKTLIEINPTITHNSNYSIFNDGKPKDKNYHYEKTKVAIDNGYRCINVWDWDDQNKVINLLKTRDKIPARKCEIKPVKTVDSISFINQYHIQGYARSSIKIGLYYNNELISIMTFSKPRYNKNYEWELIRYCSSKNVIGGAEKLFKYFLREFAPKSIISYCDLSKFTGDTYLKLGFTLDDVLISKHWYNVKTGEHILDSLLLKHGFDRLFNTNYGKGTSNRDLMLEHGFVEIYDSGQARYIYNNQ